MQIGRVGEVDGMQRQETTTLTVQVASPHRQQQQSSNLKHLANSSRG